MITVVCGIANQKVFDHCLGNSLNKQDITHKFVAEDVKLKPSKAHNSVLPQIDTKYVAFIHQDVIMMEKTWLRRAEQFCDRIPKLGMAGVLGISWEGMITGYILLHMAPREGPKKKVVKYYGAKFNSHLAGRPFKNPQLSMTLDGVVQIIPLEVFKKVRYDENIIQELSVDYCLQCKYHHDLNAYVLPLRTWHNVGRGGGRGWTYDPNESRHGYRTPFGAGNMSGANKYLGKKWRGKFTTVYSTACLHKHFGVVGGRARVIK